MVVNTHVVKRVWGYTLLFSFLLVGISPSWAGDVSFDTSFAGEQDEWQLDRRVPDKPSIRWPDGNGDTGLRFESRGMDLVTRPFEVGTGPFEFSTDVKLTKGTGTQWPRFKGVEISISSAPVDRMKETDWAVVFSVVQAGVIATVKKGGARYAVLRYKTENREAYKRPGQEIKSDRSLTGGKASTSVSWPSKSLSGRSVRLHVFRNKEDVLKFSIYHGDAPLGPWWTGRVKLPEKIRDKPLNLLTIHTGRDTLEFQNLKKTVISPGQARKMVNGVIRNMRGRTLSGDEEPSWNRPLPNDYEPTGGETPSLFHDEEQLNELRKTVRADHFEPYLNMLFRRADRHRKEIMEGESATIRFLAFAHQLKGDDSYLPALKKGLRMQAAVTDAWAEDKPGKLKQKLDLKTFSAHRFVGLSLAYSAIGDRIDRDLRMGVEMELKRYLRHYRERVEAGSWWYANGGANGSNTIGVAGGCAGMAALAMRKATPGKASNVLDMAVRTIKNEYRAIRPDGSCVEGPMYWEYGTLFPVVLARALTHVEDTNRGLLTDLHLDKAPQYAQLMIGGDGNALTFNDTQPFLPGLAPVAAATSVEDRPFLRWLSDHIAGKSEERGENSYSDRSTIPAILYRSKQPAPASTPELDTFRVLHGVEQAVMRSEGTLKPRLMTAVKGNGSVNTHHKNQDQGSFVLYARGDYLLIDPGYFEGEAVDHSLVLPDVEEPGKMQLDEGQVAPLFGREKKDVRAVRVNATKAYRNGKNGPERLTSVRRLFVQVGDLATVVLDDVQSDRGEIPLVSRFQTGFPPASESDDRFRIEGNEAGLSGYLFGPETDVALQGPHTFSDRSWVFPDYLKKTGGAWHTVQVRRTLNADRPLITVLVPTADGEVPSVESGVTYSDDRIRVRVQNDRTVTFHRTEEGWRVENP